MAQVTTPMSVELLTNDKGFGVKELKERARKLHKLVERDQFEIERDPHTTQERLIGRGNFGEVFVGKLEGSPVAVKKIWHKGIFDHELDVLCLLTHVNIVQYLGHCVFRDESFLLTEFLQHGNLRSYLKASESVSLPDAVVHLVASQLASALSYLHNHYIPIYHRDVKSPNILIVLGPTSELEKIKLADVGVACTQQIANTVHGHVGTAPWTSPELLSARESVYSPQADVYSYGVVVWELLTRQLPFSGLSQYYFADVGSGRRRLDLPAEGAAYLKRLFQCCTLFNPRLRPSLASVLGELDRIDQSPCEAEHAFKVPPEATQLERLYEQLTRDASVTLALGGLTDDMQITARAALRRLVELFLEHQDRERSHVVNVLSQENPNMQSNSS